MKIGAMLLVVSEDGLKMEQVKDRSPFFSKYQHGSGQYKATRIGDDEYMLSRMPTAHFPELLLGRVQGRARMEKFLDWWVHHDQRVVRILWCEAKEIGHSEEIVDLIIEAAHQC